MAGPRWWSRLIRPKGHIGRVTLILLAAAAGLPLVVTVSRFLAAPGAPGADWLVLEPLRALGDLANRHLTFAWAPPSAKRAIVYLLLLPTGALLVTVFRLLLGVRVFGLRAILLAVGFQAIGLLPSLALLIVVIGVISVVRPWIRRIHLPMYARLTLIISLCALVMLGATLTAPWLRSEAMWRVAFFPVIITAMIAESIAKTLEQDNLVTAVWRGGWTIVLALILLLIDGPIAHVSHQFPELVLTPLVGIILVSEFCDWRLLEEGPERLVRYATGGRFSSARRPKVAIVDSREEGGEGPAFTAALKTALQHQGFDVVVVAGGPRLVGELVRHLPAEARGGTPGGIVFNAATGARGEAGLAQVPALLEMGGIRYTGPGPLTHALLADRFALLSMLARVDVPVPRHFLIDAPSSALTVAFPAAARPRGEPEAARTIVRNRRALRRAVRAIRNSYGRPALVEEIVPGRKISVALLGTETIECLPLVETLSDPDRRACPAPLEPGVAERIRTVARLAYRTAGCRDYGRVDIRLASGDEFVVIDVKCAQLFARRGAFVVAAQAAGYDFATLMRRIVGEAARRYVAKRRAAAVASEKPSVVSLAERRAAAG